MENNTEATYMFDTNIFNHILDGSIAIKNFDSSNRYLATHIQIDELNATKSTERKKSLLKVFKEIHGTKIPTSSAVWDVSRWDESSFGGEEQFVPTESFVIGVSRLDMAKLGNADIYSYIKNKLDNIKIKKNNIHDALIAETAIKNNSILVTDDSFLLKTVKQINRRSVTLSEFIKKNEN